MFLARFAGQIRRGQARPDPCFRRKSHHFERFSGQAGSERARNVCAPASLSVRNSETGTMSQTYVIEVSSQAAGIVVRNARGYTFFAASKRFSRLDGQLFRNAREAERAAARLLKAA